MEAPGWEVPHLFQLPREGTRDSLITDCETCHGKKLAYVDLTGSVLLGIGGRSFQPGALRLLAEHPNSFLKSHNET